MNSTISVPPAFLILADEAAAWRIAGLTALDRIVLALNEWAEAFVPNEIVQAVVFWRPDVATPRWLPRHPRITRIRVTEAVSSVPAGACLLDARLFVFRDRFAEFLQNAAPIYIDQLPEETSNSWKELNIRFRNTVAGQITRRQDQSWCYVETASDVDRAEKELLRRSGKSQDGIVSRILNRSLSRLVSRFLLRFDISPLALTVSTFILPIAAFLCLARGDYGGILAGALIFQIYSVVDGCDGEIARATYQESERGGRIDDFLDMLGSVLFVIGLGFGLFRSRSSTYLLEGLICAAVIVVSEWSLRATPPNEPASGKLQDALYPRHRRLFARPGLGIFSDRTWWWILQFTKRDVAIFVFLVLAVLDQSPWILHLWLSVSAATLALSLRSATAAKHATDEAASRPQ